MRVDRLSKKIPYIEVKNRYRVSIIDNGRARGHPEDFWKRLNRRCPTRWTTYKLVLYHTSTVRRRIKLRERLFWRKPLACQRQCHANGNDNVQDFWQCDQFYLGHSMILNAEWLSHRYLVVQGKSAKDRWDRWGWNRQVMETIFEQNIFWMPSLYIFTVVFCIQKSLQATPHIKKNKHWHTHTQSSRERERERERRSKERELREKSNNNDDKGRNRERER